MEVWDTVGCSVNFIVLTMSAAEKRMVTFAKRSSLCFTHVCLAVCLSFCSQDYWVM